MKLPGRMFCRNIDDLKDLLPCIVSEIFERKRANNRVQDFDMLITHMFQLANHDILYVLQSLHLLPEDLQQFFRNYAQILANN